MSRENDAGATARRSVVPVTAAVVVANLVTLHVAHLAILKHAGVTNQTAAPLYADDVWGPLIPIVLCQVLLNGLVLTVWPPGRRAGIGILIGTFVAAALGAVWFSFVLLTSSA